MPWCAASKVSNTSYQHCEIWKMRNWDLLTESPTQFWTMMRIWWCRVIKSVRRSRSRQLRLKRTLIRLPWAETFIDHRIIQWLRWMTPSIVIQDLMGSVFVAMFTSSLGLIFFSDSVAAIDSLGQMPRHFDGALKSIEWVPYYKDCQHAAEKGRWVEEGLTYGYKSISGQGNDCEAESLETEQWNRHPDKIDRWVAMHVTLAAVAKTILLHRDVKHKAWQDEEDQQTRSCSISSGKTWYRSKNMEKNLFYGVLTICTNNTTV